MNRLADEAKGMKITIERALEVLAAMGYECPEIELLKQQLSEAQKQNVLLRETVEEVSNILADNQLWEACTLCNIALDATQDLEGLVVCVADKNYEMSELTPDGIKSFTVYRAKG